MSHDCAAPYCQEKVARSRLMCREHWRTLPFKLRAEINATWRKRERDGLAPWRASVAAARGFLGEDDADG